MKRVKLYYSRVFRRCSNYVVGILTFRTYLAVHYNYNRPVLVPVTTGTRIKHKLHTIVKCRKVLPQKLYLFFALFLIYGFMDR